MDILLIGGRSRVMDAVIDKLSKGHRIYILTGAKHMSIDTARYLNSMTSLMTATALMNYSRV